ncbi:MAG: hypothetical protein RLZZ393_847, partial [Pseudomonadota bacterium]
ANGEGTEASISNTATWGFKLTLLDKAVAKAKTLTPKVRPVRVNGRDYYVAFLHPYQVYQMRTDTNTGQWLDIQKSAMAGMQSSESPIFTGALGVYNNVILHEWSYLPSFTSSNSNITNNVYRAVLAGSQAAVMATGGGDGSSVTWREELFDYGNQLGVLGGMIFGVKKSVFNSTDFGTITMSTYSPAPS